jgi:hypothetical protein
VTRDVGDGRSQERQCETEDAGGQPAPSARTGQRADQDRADAERDCAGNRGRTRAPVAELGGRQQPAVGLLDTQ